MAAIWHLYNTNSPKLLCWYFISESGEGGNVFTKRQATRTGFPRVFETGMEPGSQCACCVSGSSITVGVQVKQCSIRNSDNGMHGVC